MPDPRSTLRRVYTTPRGVTPTFVLVLCSIVEVLNDQKQSVSNAFQYVVHRPRGSSLLKEYHSQWGNSFCKSTKKKQLSQLFRNFFFFFFCPRLFASISYSPNAKPISSRFNRVTLLAEWPWKFYGIKSYLISFPL